jgi:hypothetical protein
MSREQQIQSSKSVIKKSETFTSGMRTFVKMLFRIYGLLVGDVLFKSTPENIKLSLNVSLFTYMIQFYLSYTYFWFKHCYKDLHRNNNLLFNK